MSVIICIHNLGKIKMIAKISVIVMFVMFIILVISNCKVPDTNTIPNVIIIDSCEYFYNGPNGASWYNLTHKGNCKFCEARKQLEIQKIINHIDSVLNWK